MIGVVVGPPVGFDFSNLEHHRPTVERLSQQVSGHEQCISLEKSDGKAVH
jgi:hypothetical protein